MIQKQRTIGLMFLSPCGLMGTDEQTSLKFADRARKIESASSKKLTKLRRIIQLELTGEVPSWIGELRSLRVLKCDNAKKFSPLLANLPHLHYVYCRNEGFRAAAIAGIPGAHDLMGCAVEIERETPPAPKNRKQLATALRDDTLADASDLGGVNLEGETFEHLWITHDLAKAKLANTVWKHCDFDCSMIGADLSGAVFEDCYFSSNYRGGNLAKVKARGAQWIWCGGDLQLNGADLRDAKLYLESDTGLEIAKANLENAVVVSSFCSEREHRWEAKAANLKGAQIDLDVTPDRRAWMKKKKSSRFKWKKDHLRGAKVDKKTTRITFAPLDGNPPPPLGAPGSIDPNGPSAEVLGSLWSINASLWALIADADVAASWDGSVEGTDPKNDFQRALGKDDEAITIGKAKGFVAQLGDSGGSPIWKIPGGIMLANVRVDRKLEKQLHLRVAQWPAPKKKIKLGTVKVTSGALALLLPYENGAFTPAQRAKAKKTFVKVSSSKVLVPLPNGDYVIATAPLGPTDNYEDEVGSYGHALRIEKLSSTR